MKARRTNAIAAVIAWSATLVCGAGRAPFTNAAQESKPSSNVPAGNAENGKQLYVKNGCYECHGREGQGSVMTGPRIAPNPLPFEVIQNYIRKPSGEMPPYTAKVLPDKDLADIYAFLQSRKEPPPAAKANPLFK